MHQEMEAPQPAQWAGSQRRLLTLRQELNQQRRFRVQQLEELAMNVTEAVAASDAARLQVARVLTLAAESALHEIDAALQRLEEGAYGVCEHCDEPIPMERLEVLPMSRLCTSCQYLNESGRSRGFSVATPEPAAVWVGEGRTR